MMNVSDDFYRYKYRPITIEDLSEIVKVERAAYSHPWSQQVFKDCLRPGYHTWLMEWRGVIGAYGIMTVAVNEAHILNLCVNPRFHGVGVGRAMLDFLVNKARALKANTMFLEVRPSNKYAIKLYHRAGFNEVGTRRAYYPAAVGREDALILAMQL